MKVNLFNFQPIFKIGILNQMGDFFKSHICDCFENRVELYQYIYKNYIIEPVVYLEFGVYRGASLKEWLNLLKSPDSKLYGFDTFEGLPDDWFKLTKKMSKGEFSTNGVLPTINDNRVYFIKGLFQNTLPNFLKEKLRGRNKQKIIHMDADLYSSTLYVLTKVDELLNKGDIIIFDEFTSGDEYLAFKNYIDSYKRQYKLIGKAGKSFQQIGIMIL